MIKTFITGAVISQGYENAPALKFSEKGDAVRFRIGHKVYDPNAKDNHRWVNLPVKAFGTLCDRIRKMKLQAGSYPRHLRGGVQVLRRAGDLPPGGVRFLHRGLFCQRL